MRDRGATAATRTAYTAVGRRKRSIARVLLTPGQGNIIVNGIPMEQRFPRGAVGFFRRPRRSVDLRCSGERICVRCRAAQDGADLILHRAAVSRRAQPQPLLQRFVELPDGQAGHRKIQ